MQSKIHNPAKVFPQKLKYPGISFFFTKITKKSVVTEILHRVIALYVQKIIKKE